MEKRTTSYVILTLLLIGILSMAFKIQPVKAESGTIYIKADGSIDPPTAPISSMDNITYSFTADIFDSIVVERDNIILNGAGYTLQRTKATSSSGIDLSNRVNATVTNTRITNFTTGIKGYLSLYNNIWGNDITNNVYGINLHYSSGNNVSNNNITANIQCGIYLANSENNGICGNNITATEWYAIYLSKCSINSISSNNITNNVYGIWFDYFSNKNNVLNNNITANKGYGIYISNFSNKTSIWGNNIANNRQGIILSNSSGNSILDNKVANNLDGLILSESCNNSISSNSITANNGYGILIAAHSFINSIWGNNITATEWYGIYLSESGHNSIWGNNITANSRFGVYLSCSSRNSIWGNNIANNVYGILLCQSSYFNAISGNNITANKDYGIYLSYSSDILGFQNSVYHNNFVNNTNQVYSKESVNIWDDGYPSGGNYWSDYGGVDLYSGSYQNETGSDAIGDTSYVIDANNQDNYPLMAPLRTFNVTKNGETYKITTLSNSTIASFQYNSSLNEISFNVTGPDGTTGFCKIIVPKELGDTFEVLVDGVPTIYTQTENSTHYFLYFTYQHSTHIISITIMPSPSKLVEKLIEAIETLNLPKGTTRSLAKKLEEAHRLLEKGNENGAMHKLMDFINQVEALRGKKLTNEQADYLTSEAQRIIYLITWMN